MCSAAFGQLPLDPGDVEEHAAVGAAAPLAHFPEDTSGDVVPGEQLGWAPRRLVPLRVAPALLLVVGGLVSIVLRDVVEHEALPVPVEQDAAFAAHALRHQNPAHARRPDHAGRMELDELHVLERGTGMVGERVPVAGVLPAVAGDRVRPTDPAGGQHDRLGPEEAEASPLAVVTQRPGDPAAAGEQPDHRALHVHVDALMDRVVLERPDHLQPGAVAHVRQPGILVAAEVALENPAVAGSIEHRAPGLQLAHPVGGLARVQLRHAPVVHVLAAAHRVGEVHPPVVPVVHVPQRGGDASLGHHRVRLAEERLAHQPDLDARRRTRRSRPAVPRRPRRSPGRRARRSGTQPSDGLRRFSSRSRSPWSRAGRRGRRRRRRRDSSRPSACAAG